MMSLLKSSLRRTSPHCIFLFLIISCLTIAPIYRQHIRRVAGNSFHHKPCPHFSQAGDRIMLPADRIGHTNQRGNDAPEGARGAGNLQDRRSLHRVTQRRSASCQAWQYAVRHTTTAVICVNTDNACIGYNIVWTPEWVMRVYTISICIFVPLIAGFYVANRAVTLCYYCEDVWRVLAHFLQRTQSRTSIDGVGVSQFSWRAMFTRPISCVRSIVRLQRLLGLFVARCALVRNSLQTSCLQWVMTS